MSPQWFLMQAENAPADGRINTDLGSIFDVLFQGGFLMIPIVLCSILVVAYSLERLLVLRRGRVVPGSLARSLQDAVGRSSLNEAKTLCEKDRSPLANIALAGIRKVGSAPLGDVEKSMEDAGLREVGKLKRNIRPLSMVAGIAPLLGLLGTVFGMIEAFNVVAGAGLGKQELLASGIAKALVTTGAGLTVAIPALFMYHFFSGKIQKFVLEIDEVCAGLLDSMSGSMTGPGGSNVGFAPPATSAASASASARSVEPEVES